ncbi:hypothetical protein DM860_004390 [Cuscuta australis]|uniref:Rad21/Rec8-like protein N-terminal domain-containing protein n=1 Tax=Cuscuta australis TaxID=267555 RepID=A0A328EBH4_9ASTE|nr:hypothetical protein DM860_004390 [Cuscuta australis]
MFYARTLLARKGPLGTVWCAAHLQYRLRKADYTRTNIPSTVEFIMYPEVPIALRMSGHLLLGVVRIYSKQVDYVFQECHHLELQIRRAFVFPSINLPEGTTQESYNAVTMPETFQLDALESFEEEPNQESFVDTHLKHPEEITLEDQIPTGREQCIPTLVEMDTGRDSPRKNIDVSGLHSTPEQIDSRPPVGEEKSAGSRQSPPHQSTQRGSDERTAEGVFNQEFPETEVMRDALHTDSVPTPPLWSNRNDDFLEPDLVLIEQVEKDNPNLSPIVEEVLPSGRFSASSPRHVASSVDGRENIDSHISFDHPSVELGIRSSPPPPPPPPPPPSPKQPQPRKRRRLLIDETLVLPNKLMRAALNDTSHLKRKRKEAPHSSLGTWRSNKILKKDAMFFEPLITGQCEDLLNMHEQGFVFARAQVSSTESAREDSNSARSSSPNPNDDMDVEQLRDNQGPTDSSFFDNVSPIPTRLVSSSLTAGPSSSRQEAFTPAATTVGSQSELLVKTIDSEVVLPTPDQAASTGNLHSDKDTPVTLMDQDVHFQTKSLSNIPEYDDFAGDLRFLEDEDNSPAASQGTPEVVGLSGKQSGFESLSARSRALAQYVKGWSSATPLSKGQSSSTPVSNQGDLRLNVVLEGKSKKLSARMFYETLVLKNYGLIDVNQEESYGDITLKPTPKLLKEQL